MTTPKFELGDIVLSWEGIGRISYIKHPGDTSDPFRYRTILTDGTVSKFLNEDDFTLKQSNPNKASK